MKKVRFGIVGLGNQGTYYTSLFDGGEIPDGEITAMCDIAPSKIRAMRERGERGVRYFSDYREMLDSGLCDAVHHRMRRSCVLQRNFFVYIKSIYAEKKDLWSPFCTASAYNVYAF